MPTAFVRLSVALAALCAVLTACPSDPPPPPPGVQVNVTDPDNGKNFSYYSDNFVPVRVPLASAPQSAAEAQMLAAINAERARGGICPAASGGTVTFPARDPFIFEGHLHAAASGHAAYMASKNLIDHIGAGKSTPASRMVAAGYTPAPPSQKLVIFEESLALNIDQSAEVIAAWKTSVRHCAALFDVLTDGSAARSQNGNVVAWVLDIGGIISK